MGMQNVFLLIELIRQINNPTAFAKESIMDPLTTFYIWSIILTIAALALFVEAVALIRFFLMQRRPLWLYLFTLLPLSMSVWSFIVAFQSPPPPEFFGAHITLAIYRALMAPYISATTYVQRLLVICAVIFVLTLVIERIFHVHYRAGSQYTSNARSTSLLSRDAENTLQTMVFQSRKVY